MSESRALAMKYKTQTSCNSQFLQRNNTPTFYGAGDRVKRSFDRPQSRGASPAETPGPTNTQNGHKHQTKSLIATTTDASCNNPGFNISINYSLPSTNYQVRTTVIKPHQPRCSATTTAPGVPAMIRLSDLAIMTNARSFSEENEIVTITCSTFIDAYHSASILLHFLRFLSISVSVCLSLYYNICFYLSNYLSIYTHAHSYTQYIYIYISL